MRQIRLERGEHKTKELERRLAQVERELNEKDNETYSRQYTVFS